MPPKNTAHLAYIRDGKGVPLVLLHPIGLDHSFWRGVIAALDGSFDICAFDLTGHGGSAACMDGVTIEDLAADLAATMRADGLGSAIVVGCSLGGMVAQALAIAAPDLAQGLVLANTNFIQTEAGRTAMRARADEARKGMAQIAPGTLDRWFTPDVVAANTQGVAHIRRVLLASDALSHARCWEAIGDLDLAAGLPAITVPALVVAGGDDRSIPLEKSRALAEALPQGALHVIAGAGHLTPFERPGEFADLVKAFAEKIGKCSFQGNENHGK